MSSNVEKIFRQKLFLEILDDEDSDATNKFHSFSLQNYSKSVVFRTEFMIEEFELVLAEEYTFESGAEKSSTSCNFGLSRH